jgi:hypothetical protein
MRGEMMKLHKTFTALGLSLMTILLLNGFDNQTTNSRTKTLTSLKLESNTSSLNVGETAELTLIGAYSDNSSKTVTENIEYVTTPSNNIEVNTTILTAKKDGNVTLQAKVGNTLSNVLKLNITWVVDGHTLPPEPDKATNDSTLLGVDVNDNGVRDDVERWIYETYDEYIPCHQELDYNNTIVIRGKTIPSAIEVCEDNPVPYHPAVRAVAMQGARAAQIIIQEPEKARETREIFAKAYLCDSYITRKVTRKRNGKSEKVLNDVALGDDFDNIMFNTIERMRAYGNYNFQLSGGVYDLPTDDVILQGCSQEVHILLEGLK